jgi:hypothetical protein
LETGTPAAAARRSPIKLKTIELTRLLRRAVNEADEAPLTEAEQRASLSINSSVFSCSRDNAGVIMKALSRCDLLSFFHSEFVARLFKAAGVARTERSITNWCQPNRTGIVQMNSNFDPLERKYYLTPQSVELAIQEEKAKAAKINEPSDPAVTVRNDAVGTAERPAAGSEGDKGSIQELEKEVFNLQILNAGKDFFVEQLKKEREAFANERREYVDNLIASNRKIGESRNETVTIESAKIASFNLEDFVSEAIGFHASFLLISHGSGGPMTTR